MPDTTEGRIGYNTTFHTGAGSSPEVWTPWGQVTNVTPPGMQRDSIDASHSQSPDQWREFIAGMKDGGEVSLELTFAPANDTTEDIFEEFALDGPSATKPRKITFPDGSIWEFSAFVTGFEPEAPFDDKMVATVTLKVTGGVDPTPAA